jgi:hypothetical protein
MLPLPLNPQTPSVCVRPLTWETKFHTHTELEAVLQCSAFNLYGFIYQIGGHICLNYLQVRKRKVEAHGEWRYSSTILDLGTRWRWVVSFPPLPLYPAERAPNTHWRGGWVGPRVNLDDFDPAGTRTPPVLASGLSLYRLRYICGVIIQRLLGGTNRLREACLVADVYRTKCT